MGWLPVFVFFPRFFDIPVGSCHQDIARQIATYFYQGKPYSPLWGFLILSCCGKNYFTWSNSFKISSWMRNKDSSLPAKLFAINTKAIN